MFLRFYGLSQTGAHIDAWVSLSPECGSWSPLLTRTIEISIVIRVVVTSEGLGYSALIVLTRATPLLPWTCVAHRSCDVSTRTYLRARNSYLTNHPTSLLNFASRCRLIISASH